MEENRFSPERGFCFSEMLQSVVNLTRELDVPQHRIRGITNEMFTSSSRPRSVHKSRINSEGMYSNEAGMKDGSD
jgi:hypothetical protein